MYCFIYRYQQPKTTKCAPKRRNARLNLSKTFSPKTIECLCPNNLTLSRFCSTTLLTRHLFDQKLPLTRVKRLHLAYHGGRLSLPVPSPQCQCSGRIAAVRRCRRSQRRRIVCLTLMSCRTPPPAHWMGKRAAFLEAQRTWMKWS